MKKRKFNVKTKCRVNHEVTRKTKAAQLRRQPAGVRSVLGRSNVTFANRKIPPMILANPDGMVMRLHADFSRPVRGWDY